MALVFLSVKFSHQLVAKSHTSSTTKHTGVCFPGATLSHGPPRSGSLQCSNLYSASISGTILFLLPHVIWPYLWPYCFCVFRFYTSFPCMENYISAFIPPWDTMGCCHFPHTVLRLIFSLSPWVQWGAVLQGMFGNGIVSHRDYALAIPIAYFHSLMMGSFPEPSLISHQFYSPN